MEDDDISEFGTSIPDPNTLCTANEFRDGWVLLKGYLPFPVSAVCGTQFRGFGVPGIIFLNDGAHYGTDGTVSCDGPEKGEVFKKVRRYIDSRRRAVPDVAVDVFSDSVFAPFFTFDDPNDPSDTTI